MRIVSYLAAVLAGMTNAMSNVLDRKAAREEPASVRFRLQLIIDLMHRPVWLASIGCMIVSFALSAVALGTGELAVVQPIVILELPMTLIGGALLLNSRLGRREWIATAMMTAGVIGMLAILHVRAGPAHQVSVLHWIAGSLATVVVMLALLLAAIRERAAAREAALLGVASGVGYGLTAAYTKGFTQQFSAGGVGGVITSWQFYATIAAGVTAMWLLQNAFQAGRLAAAQPGVTLADPVTSVLWGVLVFGERVRTGPLEIVIVIPLALLAGGVILLSRSPTLKDTSGEQARPAPQRDDPRSTVR